jgi:hypothetical protein
MQGNSICLLKEKQENLSGRAAGQISEQAAPEVSDPENKFCNLGCNLENNLQL